MNYYKTMIESINSKATECEKKIEKNRNALEAKKTELDYLKEESEEAVKNQDYDKYVDCIGKIQMCETMIEQLTIPDDYEIDPTEIKQMINDIRAYTNEKITSKYKDIENMLSNVIASIDDIENYCKSSMTAFEEIERVGNKYSIIPDNISLSNARRCSRCISSLEGFKNIELKAIQKYITNSVMY